MVCDSGHFLHLELGLRELRGRWAGERSDGRRGRGLWGEQRAGISLYRMVLTGTQARCEKLVENLADTPEESWGCCPSDTEVESLDQAILSSPRVVGRVLRWACDGRKPVIFTEELTRRIQVRP